MMRLVLVVFYLSPFLLYSYEYSIVLLLRPTGQQHVSTAVWVAANGTRRRAPAGGLCAGEHLGEARGGCQEEPASPPTA